jgi:hypothetical protein
MWSATFGLKAHFPDKLVDELLSAYQDAKHYFFFGGLRLSAVEGGRFAASAKLVKSDGIYAGCKVVPSHLEFNRNYCSPMGAKSHPAVRNIAHPDAAHTSTTIEAVGSSVETDEGRRQLMRAQSSGAA